MLVYQLKAADSRNQAIRNYFFFHGENMVIMTCCRFDGNSA